MAQPQTIHGFLVVDKPGGITSRAAVDHVQRWFPRGTALGHCGTLDPLATGVLVVGVGKATRLVEYVQEMPKTYRARFALGATSDTDDAEGTVTPMGTPPIPGAIEMGAALQSFVGRIDQVPPAHSAAKVGGRRAYALARQGLAVALKPRQVTVYGIDLKSYEYPRLDIEVCCGKGTYIRSLARDLGEKLGCGAYVESLRRIAVGPFTTAAAAGWDSATEAARQRLLPFTAAVTALDRVIFGPLAAEKLRHGQAVPFSDGSPAAEGGGTPVVAAFADDETWLAVVKRDVTRGVWVPLKVFSAI